MILSSYIFRNDQILLYNVMLYFTLFSTVTVYCHLLKRLFYIMLYYILLYTINCHLQLYLIVILFYVIFKYSCSYTLLYITVFYCALLNVII